MPFSYSEHKIVKTQGFANTFIDYRSNPTPIISFWRSGPPGSER